MAKARKAPKEKPGPTLTNPAISTTVSSAAANTILQIHPITVKYWSLGGASGWLGTNTTGILTCPDGAGKYQHYVNGSIYWHQATGAHEVHGLIRARWSSMGWERSLLGYPITDETQTPDGVGRYNHFQGAVSIGTPAPGPGKCMGL
ncbi:hypothetical protein KRR40_09835 [Niabella defluvii]|nr:hypothetical protein KRR40_09835 [Niabella sp. I65]